MLKRRAFVGSVIFITLCVLFGALPFNVAMATKFTDPADLTITAREVSGSPDIREVVLTIYCNERIENAEAQFTVALGDLVIVGPTRVALGNLSKDQTYSVTTSVKLVGQGKSELRGIVTTTPNDPRSWTSAGLLFVVSGDVIVSGNVGFSSLELEAANKRLKIKTLTPEEYFKEVDRIKGGGATGMTTVTYPDGSKRKYRLGIPSN